MNTMSDRDVIAWARERAEPPFGGATAEKYRRLADLAEKGAALRETVKAWIDADVGEDQEHLDKLVEMVADPLPAPPGAGRDGGALLGEMREATSYREQCNAARARGECLTCGFAPCLCDQQ